MSSALTTDWQPIATAPRDGSQVLLRNEKHRAVKARWSWNRESQRWESQTSTRSACVTVWWSDDLEPPTEWRRP